MAFQGLSAQNIVYETFNAGMPGTWTVVDGGGSSDTWFATTNGYNGNTLNGTQFAFVDSDAAGNAPHPLLSEQLRTPIFNGNLYSQVFLEFDQYYRVYSTDRGYVEVYDGSAWVILSTLSANTGAWNSPHHATFNLTPYRNPNMQVRFRYEDNAVWAWWWAVDNVHIYAPPALDAQVTSVGLPTSQCGYTAAEAITVTGVNAGTTAITSLPLHYRVNGGPAVNEVYAATIPAGATFTYTFATAANLSAAGVHVVDAWATLPGDGISSNDSLLGTTTRNHIKVTTFPYVEDFEANPGGWFVTGTLPSWAWGTPAKTTITGAASGQRAWVTGGLGTTHHADNEDNHVEGPCLDFSATSGPWVGMDAWWNAEFSWDGANLQTSTDSGATWVDVGQYGDPYHWYTDDAVDAEPGGSTEGWTGRAATGDGSNGYVRAVHSLAYLAGEPEVLIRVSFASDGSVTDDGFAFDHFAVARQPVLYLGPDTTVCDSIVLDAGPGSAWAWSTGDSTRTLTVTTTGAYTATLFDSLGFPTQDVIQVTVEGPRTWDLGQDTLLCQAPSLTLSAGPGAQTYVWNTGATTQHITATTSGLYAVTATSAAGCARSDSILLTFSDLQAAIDPPATVICRGVPFTFYDLSTGNPTTWYWDFGNGNLSVNQHPTTVFTAGGTFVVSLEVTDGGCTDATTLSVVVDVCTAVEAGQGASIQAYPVPCAHHLYLGGLGSIAEPVTLSLQDMAGKECHHQELAGNTPLQPLRIDVAGLPAGVYILHLRGASTNWRQKVVIQR